MFSCLPCPAAGTAAIGIRIALLRGVFDQVSGLAVQFAAEGFQGGKAQSVDFVVFDPGKIGRCNADFVCEVIE